MRQGQRRFSHSVCRWLPVAASVVIPLRDRPGQVLRVSIAPDEKAVIVQDRQEGKPGNDPQFCPANSALRNISLRNGIRCDHHACQLMPLRRNAHRCEFPAHGGAVWGRTANRTGRIECDVLQQRRERIISCHVGAVRTPETRLRERPDAAQGLPRGVGF